MGIYIYDYEEKETEVISYYFDGSIIRHWASKCDNKGNEVEHIEYGADDSIERKKSQLFDDKDNIIEVIEYNTEGGIDDSRTFKYEFDTIGNWVRSTVFSKGSPLGIIEREIEYYD
jgi:hypothetical protein